MLLFTLVFGTLANASPTFIQTDGKDYSNSSYGIQNGRSNNNAVDKVIDCTSTSISGCDSSQSVLLGSYNYDNGWNGVEFDFFIPERLECVDDDFRVYMDIQLNGPTTSGRTQGWTTAVTEDGEGWSNTPTGASFVLLQFYDHTNNTWDTANANRAYKFDNGNGGTLSTTNSSQNDGTAFRQIYMDIPFDGEISRSGRTGSYYENSSNNSGLDVNLRWMNVPKNLLISGATDNLRSEIDDVTIRYEDETISPTNPSSSGTFGKVSGYDLIEKNHWSGVDKFRYNSTLQASDNCEVDYVEYIIQTSSSPAPSASASGNQIGKQVADNFDMSSEPDGAYKIWLRAVDSKGNKASWISINDEVRLDRTNPTQTGFEMNTPSSGWYNGSIAPKLTYTGNFSDTNGISYYYITLSGESGSLKNTTATSWTFDPQAQNKLGTSCGTRNVKVTAYDNALPLANYVTATRAINFDNCKPILPQLQSTQWYNSSSQQVIFSNSLDQPGESGLAYCHVDVDGTTYNISSTDCSQYFTLSLSLQDGTYQVTTTACDVAGNCNISNNVQTIKVDTTNPQLSSTPIFNSPSVNTWVKDTELSFSISADDPSVGNSVTSNVDEIYLIVQKTSEPAPTASQMVNSQYSSICTSNSCNYNISMNLSDGEWKVWYYVTDKAGNSLGPSPSQDTVKIDITSPSSVRPQWSSDVTSTSVDPFWPNSVDNGSGIDYYSLRFTDTNNNTVFSTTTNAISYSNSAVGNGTYHLCLKAIDNAGNPSAEDCTQNPVVVDKIDPIFTITSSLSGWSRTNFVTFSWNSTDNYRMDYVQYSDGTSSSGKLDENYTRNITNLAQGIHTYMFTCADLAGNIVYQNVSFGVDYTAPDVFFFSQYENYWNNVSTHFVEWNVSDQYSGLENVTIQVNSNTPLSGLGGIGNISFNFNSGIHSIKLTAFDKIGNNITETIVIKVDLATPSLSCSKNPNGWLSFLPNVYVNTAKNGTISPLTLEASYRGSPISVVNGTVTLPTSLDGVHIFNAIYSSEAGNFETCTLEILLDRRDPIQLSAIILDSIVASNSTTVQTDFYDEMSGIESISWTVDGVVVLQESSNVASRVINLTQFTDGQKTIEAEVIDKAGNALLWEGEFILDRTNPEVSIFELVAVPQSNWYSDKSVLINIEGNDNLDLNPTFELFINGNSSIVQQGEQLVELRDGENNLVLKVTDHGGLMTESTLIAYVDSVTPQCLIIPELDSNYWYNQSTRNFSLVSNSSASNLSYFEISNGIETQIQPTFSTTLNDGLQMVTVKVISESGLYSTCEKLQLVDTTADFFEMSISDDFGNYGNGIVGVNISSETGFEAPRELVIYVDGELIHQSNHSGVIKEEKSFLLESNSYNIMAVITDEAGNVFTVEEKNVEVIIDQTPMQSECSIDGLTLTENPTDSIFEEDIFSLINIICVLNDNNPVNLDNETGKLNSVMVSGNSVDEISKTEDRFTVKLALTQSSFSEKHNISFITVDMWGNEKQHEYSFIPISTGRNIQLSQGDSEYEVNWQMQYLMDEQNCLITWTIEGFDEYSSQKLCPDSNDTYSTGSIDLVEMLNQIEDEFEQSQQIQVIMEVSTSYGETKTATHKVNLETCKNQNYEFSQTTYECFQSSYDGFIFAEDNYSIYLGDNLTIAHTGQPLPLNTQCSEYNGSFTQFIDVSANLMTLNISEIDPKEDSNIPLNTNFEIAILCEDEGGFSETFVVQLSVEYQPPTLIEQIIDLSQGNEIYVLIVILVIFGLVGALVKIKNTPHIQDIEPEKTELRIEEEE